VDNKRLNHATTEEPFPVNVTVRSEKHRQLILDAARQEGMESHNDAM